MDNLKQSLKLNDSSILAFILGMLGVFIFMSLQMFQVQPLKLISPLFNGPVVETIEDKVSPRLKQIKNNYSVHAGSSFVGQADASAPYDEAAAYAAIDYDSGDVIISQNLDELLPIASLTKIMTSVVVLDLAEADEMLVVSEKASKVIPTKIGVVPGEKMSVAELLNAVLLTSANDAAEVIREGIDVKYGKGTFIDAMNIKAEFLSLSDSNFSNPQGFDSHENYSSVRDLAVLSHYALSNYPLLAEIAAKDYEFLPANENHKQFDLNNWNGLIGVYPDTIGLKIGNTGRAGHTTVVLSERDGKKILAVVLGAPGIQERDLWAAHILDAGYQALYNLDPLTITEEQFLEKYATWKYYN